ncbi:MAG: nucleotide exchange factor GrpE, partial [Acidimicrobiia bacterium]
MPTDHDAELPATAPDAAASEPDTHGEAPFLTPTPEELGIELPDDRDEAFDELLRLLADARHEAAAERDHALRALAELDNVRKRALREAAEVRQRAAEGVITQLLPVLDSFDAGFAVDTDHPDALALADGFRGVHAQLLGVLEAAGLARGAGGSGVGACRPMPAGRPPSGGTRCGVCAPRPRKDR